MKILIRPRRPAETTHNLVVLRPSTVTVTSRPQRVLDFDVEARPLSWIAADYVSKEITAIAWAWTDQPEDVTCYLLGETDPRDFLAAFRRAYDQADCVTGHYLRAYDMRMVNGCLMEYQLPTLGDKLVSDTKIDLPAQAGLSMSQESLGAMLRLSHQKEKMNQAEWRAANRLTPDGLAATRRRVIGDVRQHMELRRELIALGYLGPAKLWKAHRPMTAEPYTP